MVTRGKGKCSSKTQQAADELDYLFIFNRSITQVMARAMKDLPEGIFINMASLTLAHRDSYLAYLRPGINYCSA